MAGLDRLKLAAFAAGSILIVAWLAVLPLWLWSHGAHRAAALPWLVNAAMLLSMLAWYALVESRSGLATRHPAPAASRLAA